MADNITFDLFRFEKGEFCINKVLYAAHNSYASSDLLSEDTSRFIS